MDKFLVSISRKWHEPFVRVDVTQVGIGITMSLEDFVLAMELESNLDLKAVAERVVAGMKAESVKVM